MVKKTRMILSKKMAAGLMTAMILVSGLAAAPLTADAASDCAYGTGGTYEDMIDYPEMTDSFKECWKADGQGTVPTKSGYVFGGWYQKDGEKYTALDEEACTAALSSETAVVYAKFVPAYVLGVKAQIDAETQKSGTERGEVKAKIRVVSSVDSKEYQKVGFTILANNKTLLNVPEKKEVYEKLDCAGEEREAVQVFGSKAAFFSVCVLSGFRVKDDAKILNVTPYWITMDGTKVEGLTKYVHVEDGYLEYVSVPVNLTDAKDVAAGSLQMSYDSSILKLQDVEFDGVFPSAEMEYQNDGAGTLRFVGSAAATGTNVTANGIYANVRFKVISGSIYAGVGSGQFLNFEVTKESFCDWNETLVTIDAWDIQY